MSEAEQYARDVLSGKIVAGQFIKKACERFVSDLNRDDIYFDVVEANKIVLFCERGLNHWEDKWRGKPIILEPWQKFIYQQIYGWIVKDSGLRRVRTVFVEIAKKNSKTTMAAIMALFHLCADRINSPKIFVGANNHDQAKLCVNTAGKIVQQSPSFNQHVQRNIIDFSSYNGDIFKVIHRGRDGFIESMAKEPAGNESKQSGGKHGINPSMVVIDEYAMADSDSLLNTLENAQGAREEPLLFCITTAGHKKGGPCFSKLRDTGIKVNDGVLMDDSFLAFIWEPDKEDKIEDESTWIKSNPNFGVSVYPAFLRSQLTKAVNEGGTKMVDVQTFNFNIWVDSPDVFIPSVVWDANAHGSDAPSGECYGGIELVGGKGLSAFSLIFPGNPHKVKVLFWMPESYINNNPDKFDGYGKWLDYIKVDPGNTVENEVALRWIVEFISQYQMNSFAFPKGLETTDIVQGLVKLGYVGNDLSQAIGGISTATKEWETLLTGKEIENYKNPVLAWMNGNCNVVRKELNMRIEKNNSRVVGISATINAIAQWKDTSAKELDDKLISSW